jgi:hypothetical protein
MRGVTMPADTGERGNLWRPGDKCELIVLADGEMYDGEVTEVSGPIVHLVTDRGQHWSVPYFSPFLRRPE